MPTQPLPVIPGPTVVTPPNFFNIAASLTSTLLVPANTERLMILIFNDSTAHLNVKFGMSATASNFNIQIPPHGYFEFPLPIYLDNIYGMWTVANGFAKVTEFIQGV